MNDTFIFHAQDKQGNNTSKEVILSISIPEIEITDIEQTTS
jgi:hypothetical protein